MNVAELIELLEDMPEDAEVRFASQPSWPMEYTIDSVIEIDPSDLSSDEEEEIYMILDDMENEAEESGEEFNRAEKYQEMKDEALANRHDDGDSPEIVYLGEGRQIGYLPAVAAEQLGWR